MADPTDPQSDDARRLTLRLLGEVFGGQGTVTAGARLWDGTRWPDPTPRTATLVIKHPGALAQRASRQRGVRRWARR